MIPEFHPAAARELSAAVQSGEEHTRGLGAELKAETQRVTQLLLETPLIGEVVGGSFRRFPLRRFPFALIYRIDGDRLRILAVAHRRRRPGYWSERK
ncbi:MAG: type II toxin-antitoxin system RelE/ParE family toxin [Gammaproteobacteria bacterium]|nr:type II toxin-antitoxin system RelE/ParE family toxin [Gammaproteobacteria bacterium]